VESDPASLLGDLELGVSLRTYQRHLLDAAARPEAHGEGRLHLVAPPGSGKTLIGLELIRRFGHSAVVFAPTTTIAAQWCGEIRHFRRRDGGDPGELISTDHDGPTPIRVCSYQRLATPAAASDAFDEAARGAWVDELLADGRVETEIAGFARLEALQGADARRYRRELSRHRTRLRRAALAEGGAASVERFLHPNARALVDSLVEGGVRTVVLDECHHLLDYWALVLAYLLERLDEADGPPRCAIGLTATLPSPTSVAAEENYRLLLGDVDFEVPTPAVVKEGELAPYRDLVRLVTPSSREQAWLDDVQRSFEAALGELTTGDAFLEWVVSAALAPWLDELWPTAADDQVDAWAGFLRREPTLSIALLRCWAHLGTPWPSALPVPTEAREPIGLDDWSELLERWALDVLALSPDPDDAVRLERIRTAIAPFGLTLTERGLRQGRSPGDLLLALSESKHTATAEILLAEHLALGDRLRAVVVTDVDRMTSGPARLGGALDDDAGSARRLFRTLVDHDGAAGLTPVLVTGRVVWVGPLPGDDLAHWCNAELSRQGVDAWCEVVGTDHHRTLELVGHGTEWSPRTYVPLITSAFEEGLVRTVVGTRSLLGEGWNAPRANTLVDLTAVTTSTTAQQLRGRTIRLDASWPAKVAHNWDVTCVAPRAEGGRADLARLVRRHDHLWGIAADDVDPETGAAAVVRGVAHLDSELAAHDLDGTAGLSERLLRAVNERTAGAIGDRQESHGLWQVGAPYHDRWSAELLVDLDERAAPTATRIPVAPLAERARSRLIELLGPVGGAAGMGVVAAGVAVAGVPAMVVPAAAAATVAGVLGVRRRPEVAQAFGRWRRGVAPPEVLGAVADALRVGLVDAELVGATVASAGVDVHPAGGAWEVRLVGDDVDPDDSRRFVACLRELLGPVGDPRYLLSGPVVTAEVDGGLLTQPEQATGAAAENSAGPVDGDGPGPGADRWVRWYPVPADLGVNRSRVDALAAAWRAGLGAGEVVHTRSDVGQRVLLTARARRRAGVRTGAFERWR
jgi:superfamily II DNA or RNA helicase